MLRHDHVHVLGQLVQLTPVADDVPLTGAVAFVPEAAELPLVRMGDGVPQSHRDVEGFEAEVAPDVLRPERGSEVETEAAEVSLQGSGRGVPAIEVPVPRKQLPDGRRQDGVSGRDAISELKGGRFVDRRRAGLRLAGRRRR